MVFINSCLLFPILMVSMTIVCRACKTGKLYDNTVTEKDKSDIIEAHNMYRSLVAQGIVEKQPPAQDMQEMSWDDELAQRAQFWADMCVFKHDDERGENVGQNLFIHWFGKVGDEHQERNHSFTAAVADWFDEHQFYSYKQLEKRDNNDIITQTRHYTQVVWANTNKVGCGFAFSYRDKFQLDQILYVCNYAPSGNILGEYPYKEGTPNCEANGLSKSDTDGLCKA